MSTVHIGGIPVGDGHPCFIVAEIGINHNGSLAYALKLVELAAAAGCNAVKFQKRKVEIVYTREELEVPRTVDWSFIQHAIERTVIEGITYSVLPESSLARLMLDRTKTTNGDLKRALEFDLKEFYLIDIRCRELGIAWFASSWDGLSAHFMNGFNGPCHKIASACLTHRDLLKRVRSNGKPVILSTGGSTLEQVMRAVDVLGRDDLVILHCNATYPCLDQDVNLAVSGTLRETFPGVPVGYSSHSPEIGSALTAVAAHGASFVEVHVTLDRSMPGSDQGSSLEPHELTKLVQGIRSIERGELTLDRLVPRERQTIYHGSPEKRVYEMEIPIMKKLRLVTDY